MSSATSSLATKLTLSLAGTLTETLGLGASPEAKATITANMSSLSNGTGNAQADEIYFKADTLASSADVDLDLAGSLDDAYGNTITFASVKVICVQNTSDQGESPTTATIHVGGGDGGDGTNAFDTWISASGADGSEKIILEPGGIFLLGSPNTPYAVTAGTGDILRIINTDGSYAATYEVMIIGIAS